MNTQHNTIKQQIVELKSKLSDAVKQFLYIQKEINNFDASEYISENDYDEMLNDCYGEIEICGMSYVASYALKEVDPTAYRCGYNDYVDSIDLDAIVEYCELTEQKDELESEIDDIESELETLNDELSDIEE